VRAGQMEERTVAVKVDAHPSAPFCCALTLILGIQYRKVFVSASILWDQDVLEGEFR